MLHIAQQKLQSFAVRPVFRTAVTRGMDTRRAAERIDHQSGVIRNRGKAAGAQRRGRLDHGILLEGFSVFLRLNMQADIL